MVKTDVLILGSGIAGLTAAIKIASVNPNLRVDIVTKASFARESNTQYAQGGVASVWDFEKDNFDKHVADTLDAGDGLCDPEVVRFVVEEGPERVKEIIEWGTRFDKNDGGEMELGREGGHSENRVLHYKDVTGSEIVRALIDKVSSYENVTMRENVFAIDLITQHHLGYNITRMTPNIKCFGAYTLDKKTLDVEVYLAKRTLLATGGAGQVYKATTNPVVASGDGIAMFYRAKGLISNMEFIQFHPTALFDKDGENPVFLISEAVRGFGGVLKTLDGQEFMHKYDERGSLAPRDIVARAIDSEMKRTGDEHVGLDCRALDMAAFRDHFPNIHAKCISIGIDPAVSLIPVVPACHYTCGGIHVDQFGHTSIQQLYAAGECTSSGLHGANRLASNSLLEGLVFAHRVAQVITDNIDLQEHRDDIPAWNAHGTHEPEELVLITQSLKELKEIMSSYVGIVRSDVRLKRSMDRLGLLYRETEELYNTTTLSQQLCELRNLITIGYLITRSAAMRRESRGLHYTTDHPEQLGQVQNTYM